MPRRYSVVTRMSPEDAFFARYVLEQASFDQGFGANREELVRSLRLVLDHMSAAARTDDLDALVDCDTRFHELLIDVSGRRRLKDLWSMLNSQMGALMRAEIDRLGLDLHEVAEFHRGLVEAVSEGDINRFRVELRRHYLRGLPSHDGPAHAGTQSAGSIPPALR